MLSSLLVSTTATAYCTASPPPICPLQSVINVAARLITGNCKFDHITDTLHWLPVSQRIQFKLCSLVSKCQHRMAPSYLVDMCIPVSATSGHTHLRSAIHCDLVVPRTRLAHYGPCSFAISVPVTWNSLPPDCRETSVSAASFFSQLNRGVNLGGTGGTRPLPRIWSGAHILFWTCCVNGNDNDSFYTRIVVTIIMFIYVALIKRQKRTGIPK